MRYLHKNCNIKTCIKPKYNKMKTKSKTIYKYIPAMRTFIEIDFPRIDSILFERRNFIIRVKIK